MDLPEDLSVTGLEVQDQEPVLSSHRPVLLSFYTFSLVTPNNHWQSPQGGVGCFCYYYPIAKGPQRGKNHRENPRIVSTEHNMTETESFRVAHNLLGHSLHSHIFIHNRSCISFLKVKEMNCLTYSLACYSSVGASFS